MFKSWNDEPDQCLSPSEQAKLLKEYKQVMALMTECPILIEEKDGESKAYTAHELSSRQFSLLFSELQKKINNGEDKRQNQLILIALCAKALHKTCGKFPRSTQLLCLIHSLGQESHIIQEIKTGEGKSIINAFHAVLQVAEGKTANVVTENEQLARDGIHAFKDFYNYLGIRCGAQVIEAHSPMESYIPNGVNYSTPYGLILFFMNMELKQIKLPKNRTLIWDEIDADLTSTVQFRLAAVLNPIFHDTKRWAVIYQYLLDFVKENDLFLNNKCGKTIDVHNFRQFCLLRNPDKQLTALINKVDNGIFNGLIDSARVAEHLEADIDYMVVTKQNGTKRYYAAPILPHTNRAEERASFAAGVQPLVHIRIKGYHLVPFFFLKSNRAVKR